MDFTVESGLGNGHKLRIQDNLSPTHVTLTAYDRLNAATFTGSTDDLRAVALHIIACCDAIDHTVSQLVNNVWPKHTVHGDTVITDWGPSGYHDYHNSPRPNPDGTPRSNPGGTIREGDPVPNLPGYHYEYTPGLDGFRRPRFVKNQAALPTDEGVPANVAPAAWGVR